MGAKDFLKPINWLINESWILLIVIFVGGIIFTVLLKAYNLNFKQIFKTLKGSNKKSKNGISGFQSLMLSTASRIGNGNIAGVSLALMAGGPGALFWMWITAFLGMATAFVEGTLSQVYKEKWGDTYVGGTPFYIAKSTGKKFFKILAIVYAIFAIVTFAGPYIGVQSNTIAANFNAVAGSYIPLESWAIKIIMGVFLAFLMLLITIKGVKSIGKFSSLVMPFMGVLYLSVAFIIVILNVEKTGDVWTYIFKGAFGVKQVIGGVGGYVVATAIRSGVQRGVFSNEAGIGSASFSAASSNSKHPIQQGLLQSLSTFLDTIIICSATGFMILYSGIWTSHAGDQSGTLVQASIASQFGGEASRWLVFVVIFLFGLTTSVGLYFYSETALKFLTPKRIYHVILQMSVFGFIIYSAYKPVDFIWEIETICTFILVVINVPFMLTHIKTVKNLIQDYKKQIASGKPITYEYTCEKKIKTGNKLAKEK